MMDFKHFHAMLIVVICGVFMACADTNRTSCIIFWDYNPDISLRYLDDNSFDDCIKKFTEYTRIDFTEIEKFDAEIQVFTMKEDLDTFKLGEQYKKSKNGKLYVSIVVDNEIVFNGINGLVFKLMLPSGECPDIEKDRDLVYTTKRKYIVISKYLSFNIFEKRNTLNENLKKKLEENINHGIH